MKNFVLKTSLVVPFLAAPLIAEMVPLPDGDFESGQGAWFEISGDGVFGFEYPESGGNPGRHGLIDNTDGGGYGIWISNFNQPILLADLGLNAGEIYTFSHDMKIFSGPTLGGFKVDFFNAGNPNGSTGDIFPPMVGDGTEWATYTFDIAIPSGTDGIKLVPLWGANSRVGFDNFTVDDEAILPPSSIPDADFSAADGLAWEQTSGEGTFVFDFPGSGGNTGGYGVIDHSANNGGFAVMVTNRGLALPISGLGLLAGEGYNFSMDMRIFGGSQIGGFKVDFFNGASGNGSTGNLYPQLIGNGSTWETYEFQVRIPAGTTAIKMVPLWGPGSVVGYDNVGFDPKPIEVPELSVIPNGDFEEGSLSWEKGGEPSTTFTYETAGGNPNGYGVMTNNGTGFGVWIANGGAPIPISGLGLEAGKTYRFKQDMRLISGSRIGGLKVEFLKGTTARGDTGEVWPSLIGDGSRWETYDFEVSLPLDIDGIKLVPLWGAGSSVAFDNFTFETKAIPSDPLKNADFELAGANWSGFGVGSSFRFVTPGGNPDGYAEITNDGSVNSYGVLVGNGSNITPTSQFGITGGESYDFQVDMKIFEGSSIGGLKVEFYQGEGDAGGTGDLFPTLIGNGSTWETYTFEVFIPENVDGIKVVLLWGAGSTVGFDNVVTPGALGDGFAGWIAGFPDVGELTGFNDDPDGDGQPNGVENHLGTDPSQPSRGLNIGTVNAATGEMIFSHSINLEPVPEAAKATYHWSTDLKNFYASGEVAPDGTSITFDTNPGIPTTGLTRAIRATSTGSQVPERVFIRLQVSTASK